MQELTSFTGNSEVDAQLLSQLGGLANKVAVGIHSFGERFIFPTDTLQELQRTRDSFDSDKAITGYYGYTPSILRLLILAQSNALKFDDNTPPIEHNPQRDFDELGISTFLWRAIGRRQSATTAFDIIDFGGGVGDHFYRCSAHLNPLIRSWTVVDLPAVIADGEALRSAAKNLISDELDPGEIDGIDDLAGIEKLRFSSEIPSRARATPLETQVLCIANGVIMHLANPAEKIQSLLEVHPLGLFLGNCMEMGENLQAFANGFPKKDYLVVSGKSREFDHKFAIWQPGKLESLVRTIATECGRKVAVSIVKQRNPLDVKLYLYDDSHTGQRNVFFDAEINRSFQFFF